MQIDWTKKSPRKIQRYPGADIPRENPDLEDVLTSADVDHVAEIFQTPLTGSYNWDYTIQDDRIKKLYDLGKQLNWDPEMDIDEADYEMFKARCGGLKRLETVEDISGSERYRSICVSCNSFNPFNRAVFAWRICGNGNSTPVKAAHECGDKIKAGRVEKQDSFA